MTDNNGSGFATMARIAGMGISLPPKVMTNHDLEKIVDTSDEWITSRTGISERRIAQPGVTAAMLAAPAAVEAMERASIAPSDLDLIICATATPNMVFPSTACEIQHLIGADGCPAFDIMAACSGFIYGVTTAEKFIKSGSASNILVVATEVLSNILDWTDRSTCVLFGDGAAAAVMTKSDGPSGVIDSKIRSDGAYGDLLKAPALAARQKEDGGTSKDGRYLQMIGSQTFKVAVTNMINVSKEILEANAITLDDLDLIVPHQANMRIINAVVKGLGGTEEKAYINVNRYGNTSAASIPIALYEAENEGRLKKGNLVLLVAFGGGLTWGATLLRW